GEHGYPTRAGRSCKFGCLTPIQVTRRQVEEATRTSTWRRRRRPRARGRRRTGFRKTGRVLAGKFNSCLAPCGNAPTCSSHDFEHHEHHEHHEHLVHVRSYSGGGQQGVSHVPERSPCGDIPTRRCAPTSPCRGGRRGHAYFSVAPPSTTSSRPVT